MKAQGLHFDLKDNANRTPLHWATYQGSETAAIFLISWGADIKNADSDLGMTPLHLAVSAGSIRLVRKLLLRGANKNVKDFSGRTPLDIANDNKFDTIKSMLEDQRII